MLGNSGLRNLGVCDRASKLGEGDCQSTLVLGNRGSTNASISDCASQLGSVKVVDQADGALKFIDKTFIEIE